MNALVVLNTILALGVAAMAFWLRKVYQTLDTIRDAYATEKGKNLATKEDVAAITREIESVKADLTLNVEVRKVVAAKKVEALIKLVRMSDTLIGRVIRPRDDVVQRIATLDEFWLAVREAEALCDRAIMLAATEFGKVLQEAIVTSDTDLPHVMDAIHRAETARRGVVERVRAELQLDRLRDDEVAPPILVKVKSGEAIQPIEGAK